MHAFSNNAVGTLLDPIAFSQSVSQLLLSPEHLALFAGVDPATGVIQAITLSDPTDPSVYEIVYATEKAGNALYVTRGKEGTVKRSWSVGTVVSARVTAGMLDSFEQKKSPDGRVTLGAGSAVHGTTGVAINASSDRSGLVAIGGYPAAPYHKRAPHDMSKNVLAYESVTVTQMLSIAGAPQWEAGLTAFGISPIAPTTPDGNQYVPVLDAFPTEQAFQLGATEPAWDATGDYTPFTAASEPGVSGKWARANLTEGLVQDFGGEISLLLTEVGFIVKYAVIGTTPPSVTIEGLDGAPLVLNQPLSSIGNSNAAIASQWHRFASLPNTAVRGLRFKVDSPGNSVSFAGRFYAKGIFLSQFQLRP